MFRLGPYELARKGLDLTTVDLGDAAVAGKDIDLPQFDGRELLLTSVPDRESLASICKGGDALVYPFYRYDRCWVTTEGDFETYLASFSKTSRKGLRRRVRHLTSVSGGELDIRHFADADEMGVYYADARAVSAKTFQEKLMDDGLPAGQDFIEEMTSHARHGRCYGSILYLDDKPISYLHCEKRGSGWLAVYGGFDPAYAKLSPGTVHLLSILERSFDDRLCAFFDFGPGRSDYKQSFATDAVPSSDILLLRKTGLNHLLVRTHKALRKVTRWGGRVADRLQLKTLIRQKIRGR
ncbi:MAG: GNAT family N-acetyltransferase [Pseudomonadota bacterium]